MAHLRLSKGIMIIAGLAMGLSSMSACGRSPSNNENPGGNPTDTLPPGGGITPGGGGITPGGGGITPGGGATACDNDSMCSGETYCHFPSMSTWIPGTRGYCEAKCTGDNSCELGQRCLSGKCYSNLSCEPARGHADCAPGEVCNTQTHICGAPPTNCSFQDQCPTTWLCEANGRCTPPANLNFGACRQDADCNVVTQCGGSACWCRSNTCVPKQCLQPSDCGIGNNCVRNYCRPTTPCQSNSQCIAQNMICERNYCVQPDTCTNGAACPTGSTCNTRLAPPLCLPGSSDQCNRDEQCGVGEYCDLFSGRCSTGCRNDANCAGKCGTSACFCGNNRTCTGDSPALPGQSCGQQDQCQSGTACAPSDPMDPFCAIEGAIGGIPGLSLCERNCRPVCNLLVSLIINPCSEGESCQAPGEVLIQLIMQLISGSESFDPATSNAGFCYPQ